MEHRGAKPRIFISYSHDTTAHRERVLSLSERLRADGIETRLDQYMTGTTAEKWPRWMLDQIDGAEFILLVCTETYYRRFRGHEEPDKGKGADWEGAVITQEIYDKRSATTKFVPVLFDVADERFIPEPVRGHTFYVLNSEQAYWDLYDFLLGQAGVEPGPVGEPKRKPRRRAEPLVFGGEGGGLGHPPGLDHSNLQEIPLAKVDSGAREGAGRNDDQGRPRGWTPFVKYLKTAWRWLSQDKVLKTLTALAIIGAGLAAVIEGAWQVYLHFSEKPKETVLPTISASNSGIAAGGNVSPTASTGGIAVVTSGPVTIEASAAGKDKISIARVVVPERAQPSGGVRPFPETKPSEEGSEPQGDTPVQLSFGRGQSANAFRDCPECPEMVIIPAGSFLMGSPKQEQGRQDEESQHLVTFAKPFVIGKYEVTFDEYGRFTQETGRKLPKDEGWGHGNRPVINVSWEDAVNYAKWLGRKTGGKSYRLPSEAEWEYAARAGTTTARYWQDKQDPACNYANVYDQSGKRESDQDWWPYDCDDRFAKTAPVGSFKANNFGLYDMLGNVWEWTEDCWHGSYADAPTDGTAWTTEQCSRHVVRGGSWTSERELSTNIHQLRFAYRSWRVTGYSDSDLGFRVARAHE